MKNNRVYQTYNGLRCLNVMQPYHWYMIPKVGSRSILYWLHLNKCLNYDNPKYRVWNNQQHLPPSVFNTAIAKEREQLKELDSLFTFAFVRNPFDRLVSLFFNKIKNPDIADKHRILFFEQFKHNTFEEFAHSICDHTNINDNSTDQHIRSQYLQMPDKLHFIGRFENLNDDMEKVCQIIANKYFDKRHQNQSQHKHYTEYYKSQDLKDKVYNKYIEDFTRFNYEF